MFFFIYAAYAAFFTIMAESFPTETRAIGQGIAGIAGRIGGIISPIITGYLLEYDNGFELCIGLYASCFTVAAAFILLLKETKLKTKVNTQT